MRRSLVRFLLCAALVGFGIARVVAQPEDAPAFRFPPLPGDFGSGPGTHGGTGSRDHNPGVTAPLVPPAKPETAPKAPVTDAQQLDELFQRLAKSGDADEAKGLALAIEHLWLNSGSDTADLLMVRSVEAAGKGDLALAVRLLDKIVTIDPSWAEAWNKRATLRYLQGDDVGAMEDIAQVLALEPRHFGALSGMSSILQRNGMTKEALALIRKAMVIYPHNVDLEKVESELSLKVEGRDI
jgi:tetratricopeptide (TPR) repeat protein